LFPFGKAKDSPCKPVPLLVCGCTQKDVADYLRIQYSTINRLIRNGISKETFAQPAESFEEVP